MVDSSEAGNFAGAVEWIDKAMPHAPKTALPFLNQLKTGFQNRKPFRAEPLQNRPQDSLL